MFNIVKLCKLYTTLVVPGILTRRIKHILCQKPFTSWFWKTVETAKLRRSVPLEKSVNRFGRCWHLKCCLPPAFSCVYASVWAVTFETVDIETSFLVWCYILTISTSALSIQVIGLRSRPQWKMLYWCHLSNLLNIWLQFLASGLSLWNPPNFMKSGRFHVKSGGFHVLLFLGLSQIGLAVSLVERGEVCAHWWPDLALFSNHF